MSIYVGNKEVDTLFVGNKELDSVWVGNKEVWSNCKIIYLGNGTSFNIANYYSKYKELSASNFFCTTFSRARGSDSTRTDGSTYQYVNLNADFYKSYDANTGTLTMFNGCGSTTNILSMNRGSVDAYLVTKPSKLISLGGDKTFNVSNIEGYRDLTADNFLISSIPYHSGDHYILRNGTVLSNNASGYSELRKSYNASTGVLTCYWYAEAEDDYNNHKTWSQVCYVYLNKKGV